MEWKRLYKGLMIKAGGDSMIVECPICDATITVKNPQEGDVVVCQECDTEFELVQFDDEWDLLEVGEEDWEEDDDL